MPWLRYRVADTNLVAVQSNHADPSVSGMSPGRPFTVQPNESNELLWKTWDMQQMHPKPPMMLMELSSKHDSSGTPDAGN